MAFDRKGERVTHLGRQIELLRHALAHGGVVMRGQNGGDIEHLEFITRERYQRLVI